MTPLVSVLMPAYNHAGYVEAAIRSVLEQDYPRLELVVVDDGSADATPEVLRGLEREAEARCERVVLEFQANRGTCFTVNRLLELARGDYVLLLASDDQLAPGALTRLAAVLEAEPAVGVALGENEFMDGEGRRCGWGEGREAVAELAQAKYRTLNEYLAAVSGVDRFGPEFGTYAALLRSNHVANGYLIRRSALAHVHFTPEAPLEDYWLQLQLAKRVGYRSVPDVTFRYRWHAGNTSHRQGRMLAMTRLTLECEARQHGAELAAAERAALAATLARWRSRTLVALPAASAAQFDVRALRVPAETLALGGESEADFRAALAEVDLRGYGFVAHLAATGLKWRPRVWRRLWRCFADPAVEMVALGRSRVYRVAALAAAGDRPLRSPPWWRRWWLALA